jgi:Tfp pilus assembly protein PilF
MMKRSLSILFLVLGLTGYFLFRPVFSGAQEDGDSVAFTDMDQMIFDARQAFRQGHYDEAIVTCEKIIRKDPNQMTALKIMGSSYALLDEPDRARHVFEYALKINPDDPDIPKFLAHLRPADAN